MTLKPPEDKSVVQRYLPVGDALVRYDWVGGLGVDVHAALPGVGSVVRCGVV